MPEKKIGKERWRESKRELGNPVTCLSTNGK